LSFGANGPPNFSPQGLALKGAIETDDGDALALTFAQAAVPAEVEERDEDEEFGGCAPMAPKRGCDESH
jgi:hypothetical protein